MTKTAENLEELDVVALLRDLPEDGLVRGQVGTIVDLNKASGTMLVEFCDSEGRALAIPTLERTDVLRLQYEAASAAE
jgi:hypothetical protein